MPWKPKHNRDLLIQMWREGRSLAEIAAATGYKSEGSVSVTACNLGLGPRPVVPVETAPSA